MKLQSRLIAGLLLCTTLGGISGCMYGGNGRYGDRNDQRRNDHYYSEQRRYCESAHRRDNEYYDCRAYDQRRYEYERRNR